MVQEDKPQGLLALVEAQIAIVAQMPDSVAGKSTNKVRASLDRFYKALVGCHGQADLIAQQGDNDCLPQDDARLVFYLEHLEELQDRGQFDWDCITEADLPSVEVLFRQQFTVLYQGEIQEILGFDFDVSVLMRLSSRELWSALDALRNPCGPGYAPGCFDDPTPSSYFVTDGWPSPTGNTIYMPFPEITGARGKRPELARASLMMWPYYGTMSQIPGLTPIEELAAWINVHEHSTIQPEGEELVYLYDLVLFTLVGVGNAELEIDPKELNPDLINLYLTIPGLVDGVEIPDGITNEERWLSEALAGWSVVLFDQETVDDPDHPGDPDYRVSREIRDEAFLEEVVAPLSQEEHSRFLDLDAIAGHRDPAYIEALSQGEITYQVGGETIAFDPRALKTFSGSEFGNTWLMRNYPQILTLKTSEGHDYRVSLYRHRFVNLDREQGDIGFYLMTDWQQNFAYELARTRTGISSIEELKAAAYNSGFIQVP